MRACLFALILVWLVSWGSAQDIQDEIKNAQAEIATTKPYLFPESLLGWSCLVGGTAWVVAGAFQSTGTGNQDGALVGGLALEILGGGLIALAGGSEKRLRLLKDRIDYVGYATVPDDEKLLVLRGEYRVGMQESSFLLAAGPPMDLDSDALKVSHRQLIYPWGSAIAEHGVISSIEKKTGLWMWD